MAAAKELASSVLKSGKRGAAGAERGASESILNKELQSTLDLLKQTLAKDAEKIAAGQKPFFRSPEEAAAYWDKAYKEISSNMTKGIYPIGPNATRITYKKDGQLFTLDRDVKPPAGSERVSLTDADVLKMMPPRPQVPPKPAGEPNGYNNPPPPDYMARPQPSPAAQASVNAAAPPPANPTVDLARETVTGARGTVPNVDPRMRPNPPQPGPWGAKPQPTAEPSNLSVYGAPAAIGAGAVGTGVMYGADPEGTQKMLNKAFNVVTGGTDVVPSNRSESPNLDNIPYAGPNVSYGPDDFQSDNVANNPDFNPHMWSPPVSSAQEYSGRENPNFYPEHITPPTPERSGREMGPFPVDRGYTGPGVSYDRSDFAPNGAVSVARQVMQRAQNSPQAQAQRAAAVLNESPNQLTIQRGADQGPSMLTRFIRGDWTEGSDKRIMDAVKRQREESGIDDSGRASGGAAPKKQSRDDVLHKALEIIHHMLSRR